MDKATRAALAGEIEDYWDERAESYSNGVRGELGDGRRQAWQRVLERAAGGYIVESAFEKSEKRALDLGCGPGFFSILLAEMGFKVDAVDESGEMLARATSNARESSVEDRITFHKGDVTNLPFGDDAFDFIACRNLTWLMLDPEGAYAEWLRVLAPGGKLVVFDANWYRYLVDEEVAARREFDQLNNVLEGWDESAQATSDEEKRCEEMAALLPLTPVLRPQWDLDLLARLGSVHAVADEGIWYEVWTQNEQDYYGATPMFMIEAVKQEPGRG